MNRLHLLSVAFVSSIAAAIGCSGGAPPGTSSQDLGSGSPTSTSSACTWHKLQSDVCVYDWEWKVEAGDECTKLGGVLVEFDVVQACNSGPTQSASQPSATEAKYECCPGMIDPG